MDVLSTLPDESVQCCVTSPPYWGLRDYKVSGQIGLESSLEDYVSKLVAVFSAVYRVLSNDGTLWLNLGDSYNAYNGNRGQSTSFQKATEKALPALPKGAGLSCKVLKNKDLIGVPWRVAFALRDSGWYLRQDIIWSKPNAMPESVRDRCTRSHEYIFMLSKSARYYYDIDAIKEAAVSQHSSGNNQNSRGHFSKSVPWIAAETRNRRSVWSIPTKPFRGAHFATFPPALIEPCILAGCPEGGIVLDPFAGAGTTGVVAQKLGRSALLIELNPEYVELTLKRLKETA